MSNPENQEFRKKLLKNLESIEIIKNPDDYTRKQSFVHLPRKKKSKLTKSLSVFSHKPIASITTTSLFKNFKKTKSIVVKSSFKPEKFIKDIRITEKPKKIEPIVVDSQESCYKPNLLPLEKTDSDPSNSEKYSEESEFEKKQKEYYNSFQSEFQEFQSVFSKESLVHPEKLQTPEKNKQKISPKNLFIYGNKIDLNLRNSKKNIRTKEIIKNNSNICFDSNSSKIVWSSLRPSLKSISEIHLKKAVLSNLSEKKFPQVKSYKKLKFP